MTKAVLLAVALCTAVTAAAEPVPENIRFANGEVELSGTIVRPPAKESVPGIVFVHGSGPHTREGPVQYAEVFNQAGVGLLAFDKRGTGESTGNWIAASLDDLAADICAAVEFLRSREDFDGERIGLWGISQGGWVAPLAASRCGPIAFMIVVSGGGASPLQSELYSYRRAFENADLPAEQQAEAFSVIGDYFWYLGTGRDREAIARRLEAVKVHPWYRYAALGRIMPSEVNRPNWEWVASFDPLLSISRFTGPVLLIFGDRDDQQPTELAIKRWQQGLRLAGNDRLTIRVFEGANHGIRVGGEGHHRGDLAPGYPQAVREWLRQNAGRADD